VKFVEKGNGNVENAAGSSFIEENVAQHWFLTENLKFC
jgi:hypothetical protein